MNRSNLKIVLVALAFSSGLFVTSCKGKQKDETTADTTVTAPAPAPTTTAPVTISPDDSLTTGVKDATKDYPKVNATVNDGEITLTGDIERSKLPALMQTLNSLKPKKINNQLTIK